MALATGHTIGQKLCEALGIDSKDVAGLDIRVRPNEVVTVTVSRFASHDQMDVAMAVLSEYELTAKPEPKG